jgi:hypothetical protein
MTMTEAAAHAHTNQLVQIDADINQLRNVVAMMNGLIEKLAKSYDYTVVTTIEEQEGMTGDGRYLPFIHLDVAVRL